MIIPKITYKLLDNDTGVITARTPVVTDVQAEICFDGYPENALAVFKYGTGREVYRELVGGKCLIEHQVQDDGSANSCSTTTYRVER